MSAAVIETDVLVLGGGLAATWAASAAAAGGADVVLADKGFCGTSGVTATAGPGHWWVPPDPAMREAAIREREALAEGLAERSWMARILDETWRTLPTLATHYAFPRNEAGVVQYRNMRGPEYMRAMRRLVRKSGALIMDGSPALELLLHADGSVAGARGIDRVTLTPWIVRAGAVVLATGGCAFMSHLLGCHTNTGDGALMAAEAGADLSGMEFSAYYTVAPAFSTMTRSMSYAFATYTDAAGQELDIPSGRAATEALALALQAGPVFCSLARMPRDIRERLTRIQPNLMLPFVRHRIDPFTDRFEVTLRGEGTIRGTGGVRITGDDCATAVPGLYAAGDVATREMVTGAISGGGAQNSAWALSSGRWAGQAAAARARSTGRRAERPADAIGGAGLRPRQAPAPVDLKAMVASVQAEMLPTEKNLFRSAAGLSASRERLDALWREIRAFGHGTGPSALRGREAAAMTALARWCVGAALARGESRGMHRRTDAPVRDPRLGHRLIVGGLDEVWVRAATVAAREAA
jgi:succinate dehydrogenase/fumarate reductase flavoprotein subunit